MLASANPTSFFKDADGIVHLAGVPTAADGPGGDTTCDGANPSDLAIFRLPAGYRPARLEVFPSPNSTIQLNLIAPVGGVMVGGVLVPGGTVFASAISDGNATTLDGFTFRAAGPASASRAGETRPSVSLRSLRNLLG